MKRQSIYKRYVPSIKPEQTEADQSYWFAFCESKLLTRAEKDKFWIPHIKSLAELKLTPTRVHYLGAFEGYPCYSAELPPGTPPPEGLTFTELRPLYFGIEEDLFLLAGRAIQILSWDQTHQFCGRCGHPTETMPGERAKVCPVCKFISYPRISPAVIVAVLKDGKILLTKYAAFRVGNMRTIIAGFLEPGETLEECVEREVQEEVGIKVKNIKYFGNQPWPFPNSLMIGFTAEYASGDIHVDGKEIAEADWYDAQHMPAVPPPMSISREIIDWFVENHGGGSLTTFKF